MSERHTDRKTGKTPVGQMDGTADGRVDGRMIGQMDRWTDGKTEGWTDRHANIQTGLHSCKRTDR